MKSYPKLTRRSSVAFVNADEGGQTRKIPGAFPSLACSDFEEHEPCFCPIVAGCLAHSSFEPSSVTVSSRYWFRDFKRSLG